MNITIRSLNINTAPNPPEPTIGFGNQWHNPATTTLYPASPVDQRIQQWFQPSVTGHQIIAKKTTADTPLLEENGCDLSKMILQPDHQLWHPNCSNCIDKITLSLTAFIKKSIPILPDFHHINTSK